MKKHSLLSLILALAICAALLIAPLTGVAAAGTEEEPTVLELTDGAASIEGGAYPGTYYTWTAPAHGELTLEYTGSESVYYVTAYVVDNAALANISLSAFSDAKSGSMTVDKDDVVLIQISGDETTETVKVTANVSFEEKEAEAGRTEGTMENPYIAESIAELTFNVEELLSDYVYKWEAPANGTLTFGFNEMVAGAMLKVNGNDYLLGEPVEVTQGEAVYVSLAINPKLGTPGTYTLFGTFTAAEVPEEPAVGTLENPHIITSVELLNCGTMEPEQFYYFQWTAPSSGNLSLTYKGHEGVGVMLMINGESTEVYSGEPVAVTGGQPIIIAVFLNPRLAHAATEVEVTGAFEAVVVNTTGSFENPDVITELGKLDCGTINPGDYYYYQWTATGNGNLTIGLDAESGYGAGIAVYVDGEMIVAQLDVPFEVKKGQEVLIGGFVNPRLAMEAADVILNVAFEQTVTPGPNPGETPDNPGTPDTGDNALVFVTMAVVSMIGLAVVVSKKKAF